MILELTAQIRYFFLWFTCLKGYFSRHFDDLVNGRLRLELSVLRPHFVLQRLEALLEACGPQLADSPRDWDDTPYDHSTDARAAVPETNAFKTFLSARPADITTRKLQVRALPTCVRRPCSRGPALGCGLIELHVRCQQT